MTKRVTEGARRERHSLPASRRSRARALPSLNQRLLAVYLIVWSLASLATRQVSAIDSVRNKEVFIPHRCNSVPEKRQVSVWCPSQRCVRNKEESTRRSSNREGWQRGNELICYGINNTRPRKRKSRFTKSLRLLFIGSILNEIQPFKNSKVY